MLAIGILLASLIVLSQMASVGRLHAASAEKAAIAQTHCRTILGEILAGARPAEPVESQPVTGAPDWLFSIEAHPQGRFGLVAIRVTVAEARQETVGDGQSSRGKRFSLMRWMYRPDDDTTAIGGDLFRTTFDDLELDTAGGLDF